MLISSLGPISLWDSDEFEQDVMAGLSLMSESRFAANSAALAQNTGVTKQDINNLRSTGPYFPPVDLIKGDAFYKVNNNCLPLNGALSFGKGAEFFTSLSGGQHVPYAVTFNAKRIKKLPSHILRLGGGLPYEIIMYYGLSDIPGFQAYKHYATVDNLGNVHGTYLNPGEEDRSLNPTDDDRIQNIQASGGQLGLILNATIDRRLLWNVKAKEGSIGATFGVVEEQIKSLFYARSLPTTETGRKSPILHWVASHKRRLEKGIDVSVKEHLRGVNSFEMYGTNFLITNPLKTVDK